VIDHNCLLAVAAMELESVVVHDSMAEAVEKNIRLSHPIESF
jgi:hypothetical protein